MKNILFQKIPIDENGNFLLPMELIDRIHNHTQRKLSIDDNNCILITSPMDIQKIDGDIKIIHIDCREYSYNELQEIIEKAEMYNGLCK